MKGIVIKSTGSWFTVREKSGNIVDCKIKGNFRIKGIKTTNPVAVGDHVDFKYLEDKYTGLIFNIELRHNYIVRKATKLSKQSHIIAANIDQALLIVTLAQPRTSTGFIDRFLVTSEAYHIPARIIFNKFDLYNEKQKQDLKELQLVYEDAGYPCYSVSAKEKTNLDQIIDLMTNKVSLFSGHSGVGKSALINVIESGINIKTGSISEAHQKGTHTTTFAEMHSLSFGGYIIDTPGIKEFGLSDFKKEEVCERFPEMRRYMLKCKFNNCTHVHEPGCAVVEALKNGKISADRYKNYLGIMDDDYFNNKQY